MSNAESTSGAGVSTTTTSTSTSSGPVARLNEAELVAMLTSDVGKIGEIVRGGTSQFVELDRLGWIEVLKKANPGMDVLKSRVSELLEGALRATSTTVAVDRRNAVVVCRLASV